MHIRGKIPITIHPSFWIFAALIGYLYTRNWIEALIWVVIIFISVLFHEFGHALTARLFGRSPRIELVALGGLTYHDGDKLPFWKQFFIVLNGPIFGLLLYFLSLFIFPFVKSESGMKIVKDAGVINLFWTVLNLLPVLPLDGGQLLRIILESIFGARGFKYTLLVGIICAVAVSLGFFILQNLLAGAFFFLFAFQCYETYRRSKSISEPDRSIELRTLFEAAEKVLQEGKKEEALDRFEKIRQKAKKGILYTLASQYSAFIHYERGKLHECYELLSPIHKDLTPDALCLLHHAAFEEKDYPLVLELAGPCFQIAPSIESALRNALAAAKLSQTKAAIGWLQTAVSKGLKDLSPILKDPAFDAIRDDPHFKAFLNSLES